jgi:hypothetical protein
MKIQVVLAVALATAFAMPELRADDGAPVPGATVRVNRWVNLASPIPSRHGVESIAIGRQAGAFRSLRIAAVSGTVGLRSVRVEFSDGRMATFFVARRLDRDSPSTIIDLESPRLIDNIVVMTAKKPAGSYAVFGAQGRSPGADLIARK